MGKLERAVVVHEALNLLDEVGLDAVSTRALARRLGVEQPSLYWHFRNKQELLAAMAASALTEHGTQPLPVDGAQWGTWFLDNFRSFRRELLGRRDGARLHAGTTPAGETRVRLLAKLRFLVDAGVPEDTAVAGMLAASRFTVGSALEQQADPDPHPDPDADTADGPSVPTHTQAFEAGLRLILVGLEQAAATTSPSARVLP